MSTISSSACGETPPGWSSATRRPIGRRAVAGLIFALLASLGACGEGPGPGPGAAGEAAADRGLAPDWALLSVSSEGGTARLHPLDDPGRELWSGAVSLPPASMAVRVAPRLVAFRSPGGGVYRYDPAEDAVAQVGELEGEVRWHGGDGGGVWIRPGDGGGATLVRLSAEGADRRSVDRPVRWAGPAAGDATVALLGTDPAALVRWPRGAGEAEASLELPVGPPATVTAWGRTAVLTRTDAEGALQMVSLEEMEAGPRIEVGGPVTALAASPSSHQLYVGLGDPPRVVVVGRISGEVRTRARLPSTPRRIRPGVAGGPPVVWDGRAAHLLPWGDGEPVRLEGSWRPDLPLALPDGSVLVARDGSVERARVEGGGRPSAGSGDRLWVPVRWRAKLEAAAREADTTASAGARAGEDPADTEAAGGRGDTISGRADSAEAAGGSRRDDRLDASLKVTEPGFYVVLGWSRSPGGVRERLRDVREAGFPVAVEMRRDDAGDRWYRGLVGPYGGRRRARGVARTLQREHSLDGWVQEVRPGLPSDGVGR